MNEAVILCGGLILGYWGSGAGLGLEVKVRWKLEVSRVEGMM